MPVSATIPRRRLAALAAIACAVAVSIPLGLTAAAVGSSPAAAPTFPDADGRLFVASLGVCAPLGLRVTTEGGEQLLAPLDSGWYDESGLHQSGNRNYIVGTYEGQGYRNFFVFDTASVAAAVTTATLEVPQAGCGTRGEPPVSTYRLYEVDTPLPDLVADHTNAVDTFDDLGGGVAYGRQAIVDPNQDVSVPLTAEAVNALNAGRGEAFVLGGVYSDQAAQPTITAAVRAARPRTPSGWYGTPVIVEFACTSGYGLDTAGCPEPLVLDRSKVWFVGGSASDTEGNRVEKQLRVKVDTVRPRLYVKHVRAGKTYTKAPKVGCAAIDRRSRLAGPCEITTRLVRSNNKRQVMRFDAIATDRAGNSRTKAGSYIVRR